MGELTTPTIVVRGLIVGGMKIMAQLIQKKMTTETGNTNRGGRLSTVDLLIKVGCFVKK